MAEDHDDFDDFLVKLRVNYFPYQAEWGVL